MNELTVEETAEVIRAIKKQHPGAGPGAYVDLKIYSPHCLSIFVTDEGVVAS